VLHHEVRLAQRDAAGDRCADTGGGRGIAAVEVEREVEAGGAVVRDLERLLHHAVDAEHVDLAHREGADAALPHEFRLAGVHVADPDQHRVRDVDHRGAIPEPGQHVGAVPEATGERHTEPDQPDPLVAARVEAADAGHRPAGDRVVAPHHQRQAPALEHANDLVAQPGAALGDLAQEARLRIARVTPFGALDGHVPEVLEVAAQGLDGALRAGDAERAGPHVDAAQPAPEVHRNAEQRDVASDRVTHGGESVRAGGEGTEVGALERRVAGSAAAGQLVERGQAAPLSDREAQPPDVGVLSLGRR
jgi:hypothetical protein